MAKFSELCEKDDLYICDKCHGTFKAREVTLKPTGQNFKICTPGYHIMVVEKDGTIAGKQSFNKGDRSLACPHCGYDHPNGFDLVKNLK